MGLDMYLYKRKDGQEDVEIGYWRKHPNLHGHINQIYRKKGGKDVFNCQEVELSREEMEEIIDLSKKHGLPKTEGFFFGTSEPEQDDETIEIMENAIKEQNDGFKIIYNSWW